MQKISLNRHTRLREGQKVTKRISNQNKIIFTKVIKVIVWFLQYVASFIPKTSSFYLSEATKNLRVAIWLGRNIE